MGKGRLIESLQLDSATFLSRHKKVAKERRSLRRREGLPSCLKSANSVRGNDMHPCIPRPSPAIHGRVSLSLCEYTLHRKCEPILKMLLYYLEFTLLFSKLKNTREGQDVQVQRRAWVHALSIVKIV